MPSKLAKARASALDWRPWAPEARGRVLLVAELANAHEGKPETALKMVEAAAEAGCDAVKFQKYFTDEMLADGHGMRKLFLGLEWGAESWARLIERAKELGLAVFMDVFGERAYGSLKDLPAVDGLKIHASELGNVPLLEAIAKDPRPLLIGTGGSSDLDIFTALSRLGDKSRVVLLHGYQAFPTPLEDTALVRLPHLLETFGTAVGLSDHLDASLPFAKTLPLLSVPLGACVIEKHLTLDRSARGIDFQSSLEPAELKELAVQLRQAEAALGGVALPKSASEESYRRRFKKSLVAARPIAQGSAVQAADLAFRMTESPARHSLAYDEALGSKAARDIPAGAILSAKDLGATAGLCLIARLKSTRLPRKAVAAIHSRTAIERLFERAKLCKAAERVVLCTSTDPQDAPLLEAAAQAKIEAYAGSPEEPLERLLACARKYGWKYVIRATADNIFLDPELLAQAVDLAADRNLDYVSMFTAPVGVHCEVMSRSALETIAARADAAFSSEYLTWFLVGSPNFRAADLELPPGLRRNWRLTLDTPEDLQNIRDTVARLGADNHAYTLKDLVAAVEADPALEARLRMPPNEPKPPTPVKFKFK